MSALLRLRNAEVATLPGETVLAALRRSGVHLLYACEEGCCHACILRTDARVPPAACRGLSAALRSEGAFLACQWVPEGTVRIFLPGERHDVREA